MLAKILQIKWSKNRFSHLILFAAVLVAMLGQRVFANPEVLVEPKNLGPIICGIQKVEKDGRVGFLAEGHLETLFFGGGMTGAPVSRSGFERFIPDLSRGDFIQIKIHYYDREHPERNYEKDPTPRIAVESTRQGSESHVGYRTYFYPIDRITADRPHDCGFNFNYSLELDSTISVRCKTFECVH